jgi:CDP-2,3-bis-(O-geranylgeranyl)-sn-glycerol synthase
VGREILATLLLLLPLLGGAALHGVCMRTGWLGWLARPIDGGRTLGGRPLFGRSKTWRGPVLVGAGAALVWVLEQQALAALPWSVALDGVDLRALPGAGFAALAGFAGELAELPNSFVKRRLGIAPGATARGPLSVVFYLWDQLDVLTGYGLVLATLVRPTPLRVAVAALAVGAVHPLLTWLGYGLRMRPTPR